MKHLVYYLLGALILCIPALVNGYPFVYSDTGTYFTTGFDFILPEERPIFYGLFLMISSLRLSAWLIIITQGLIGFFLINECFLLVLNSKQNSLKYSIISVVILSCTSNLGVSNCTLIPDIFEGYFVLAFALILLKKNNRIRTLLLYVIFLMGLTFHSSAIPIFIVVLSVLAVTYLSFKKKFKNIEGMKFMKQSYLIMFVTTIFISVFFILVNGLFFKSYSLNAFSNVFICGKYCETGILKYMLTEEEKSGNIYQLTIYKDSLPKSAQEFIWDPNSPLNKVGGWMKVKDELKEIAKLPYTKPNYFFKNATSIIGGTLTQLVTFKNGYGLYAYADWSAPYKAINMYLPHEFKLFCNSMQQKGELNFKYLDFAQWLILCASIIAIVLLIVKRQIEEKMVVFLYLIILFLFANAFICGGFVNSIDRLQARVVWLIVLIALLLIGSRVEFKSKS